MKNRAVADAARGNSRLCRRDLLTRAISAAAAMLALAMPASAYDLHFDYTSFEATFKQAQFDVLNYPSINGNYMMTSTDNHRPEMVANGNNLAEFYNWLNQRYDAHTTKDGNLSADEIDAYVVQNSTKNGPKPKWLILNEISPSRWSTNPGSPSISTYRTWLIDCVTRLHEHYGYDVITLAPWQEPQQNNASWQALSAVSYIGIECYLSGPEVWNSGSNYAERLNWAQSEYQDSKNAYIARGVPADKLFVTEHFANNGTVLENGTPIKWGRAGLASASDWDQVIMIRQDAILNVGFDGFLAYNWGGNGMGITEAEQIQHEYHYRSRRVLASQKPQWLSDSAINVNGTTIPLSWSQPLNWLGGVPNASGAEANFWRTNTAARTITLDGSKTVGKLSFESPNSYTISTGTSGNLVLNNSGSAATLTSNQGSHTISANVQLPNGVTATINTGTFTISGIASGTGGLIKTGAGTLALTGANTYTGNTTVQAGTLRIGNRFLANSADVLLMPGATLNLIFAGSPDIIDSLFINGMSQAAGIWGAVGSGAEFTSSLITGTGRLQITTGPLVGDYNKDSVVDSADYVVWRHRVGSATISNRHPNSAATVGQADYDAWRARFGQSSQSSGSGSAAGSPSQLAIPEPAGCWLLLGPAVAVIVFSRHRWRRAYDR